MKRRREGLTQTMIAFAVLACLATVLLLFTRDAAGSGAPGRPGSARSVGPRGLRRLRLALERAGHPVQVIDADERPLMNSVVLIVEPGRRPPPGAARHLESALSLNQIDLVAAGDEDQLRFLPEALLPSSLPELVPVLAPIRVVASLPFSPRYAGVGSDELVRAFAWEPPGTTTVAVAGSPPRPVIVAGRPLGPGGGKVFLCSEPRIFENRWIGELENVEVVAGLLATRPRVCFDDRWPEPSRHGRRVMAMLYGTRAGRSIVLALLAAACALFLAGILPGGPLDRPPGRRHPGEYVESMAWLLLSVGPPQDLLRAFQEDFRRRACARLGLPPETHPTVLAAHIAARTGASEEDVLLVIDRLCESTAVPAWVRRLDALEKKL